MSELTIVPEVVCPICGKKNFESEIKGFLKKTVFLRCRSCGSYMETGTDQKEFLVKSVGSDYQGVKHMVEGKVFRVEGLEKLPGMYGLIPDNELTEMSNGRGDCFEAFISRDAAWGNLVVLKKDEKVMWGISDIGLNEERSKRVYTPTRGVSFRIVKGVRYHVGGVGESVYSSGLKLLDTGNLFITTQRYIFQGRIQNIAQPLKKVTSVSPYIDGLAISRENKQKVEYYITSKKANWVFISALIKGLAVRFG
jgi:hypothetical protein